MAGLRPPTTTAARDRPGPQPSAGRTRAGFSGGPNEPEVARHPAGLSRRQASPGAGTAGFPFCQACAPALIAALAWVHLSLASSLGATSISLTHCRVAVSRWAPPTASPARTIAVPVPTIAAL